jgi:hypothetical protein
MKLIILILIGCVRAEHYLECRVQNERGYQLENYRVSVKPGGQVLLLCQVFVNNVDENHDPSQLTAFSMLNISQKTLNSYPSNETRMWQRPVVFVAPTDNQLAYETNGKKIKCQYNSLFCYVQINVLFTPFVDSTIEKTQLVNVGDENARVECPIRAPTYGDYYMIWHTDIPAVEAYTINSYLLHLSRVDYSINNQKLTCSLYSNVTGFKMLEDTITVQVTQSCFFLIIILLCLAAHTPRFFIFLYTRATGDGQAGIRVAVRDGQERTGDVGLERGGGPPLPLLLLPLPPPLPLIEC